MKKRVIIIMAALMVSLNACANNSKDDKKETKAPSAAAKPAESTPEETPMPDAGDALSGLTLNEYPGLEMSAAVLPRKATLPGDVIPVTVTIKNNGDQTISYVQGSGSFKTPQALLVDFKELQPIRPQDQLGIAVRNFVWKELKPQETLEFVVNILAIEPNKNFETYTFDLYSQEQRYIAEVGWDSLQKKYSDLIAAKPGSYTGTISFQYAIAKEGSSSPANEPTGYAQAEITVSVM